MIRVTAFATILATAIFRASAFQASSSYALHQFRGIASSDSYYDDAGQTCLLQTYNDGEGTLKHREIFLLSLEGTLVSTTRSRARIAIKAALAVWPSLVKTARTLNLNTSSIQDDSWNWLIEKLSALTSMTQQGNTPDKMLGCDAVFLVRVLLEEQLLDGGRSNGRGGKYGSKFHPGWTSDFDSDGSVVGSRPLTVGELHANWDELREVMEFKYPFVIEETGTKSDPMPRIRQVLNELMVNETEEIQHIWQPVINDIFHSNQDDKTIILMLGHEAELSSAIGALTSMGISSVDTRLDWDTPQFQLKKCQNAQGLGCEDTILTVVSSEHACDQLLMNQEHNPSLILVVPNTGQEEFQSEVIRKIICDIDAKIPSYSNNEYGQESYISVVHSSLDVLRQCKLFLGEDP